MDDTYYDNYLRNLQAEHYGQIKSTQTRFTWVINDFGNTVHKCKSIMSPVFTTFTDSFQTQWVLFLYPNGQSEEPQDNIAIGIRCLNRNIVASVELSVLNIDGIKSYIHSFDACEFNGPDMWIGRQGKGYVVNDFLKRSEILVEHRRFYIRNGSLHIVCIITTNDTIQADCIKSMEQKNLLQKLSEFSKFKHLLNDTDFSDVTFHIEGKEIQAHKAILACSSSVFRAMFTHRMSEKKSSQVKIEDFDINTMKAMLKFIYTAELEQFDSDKYENYLKLLTAAEKYCIESLKEKCEEVLSKELTVDNVLDCIVNADIHNALDLKKAAIDFAAANAEEVVLGPTFEDFMKCSTTISCEVVRVLVTKRRRLN